MSKADIGVVGLGVMGRNLALNMADHGYIVAGYDRDSEKVEAFEAADGKEGTLMGCRSSHELVSNLKSPRTVFAMVPAGKIVDAVVDEFSPLMERGDILIDGGNSYFCDTNRRADELAKKGVHFIGMGVSGGEEGARHGPSLMPGGHEEAWPHVRKLFQDIAARAEGEPCCEWVGSGGAGHFVKMVHNGIEYSDMQLICEAYFMLTQLTDLSPAEVGDVFETWNTGDLDSYLIEITAKILRETDPDTSRPMVDVILDSAGQKGTGKWTSQIALDLGIPAATMAEAVFARTISALKEERVHASTILKGVERNGTVHTDTFVDSVRQALLASKICCYAQGFSLIKAASEEYGWNIDLGQLALLWREGCIIRAKFLGRIKESYDRDAALANLLLDPYFAGLIHKGQKAWRDVVSTAIHSGLPVPAFSSALAYFDSYRTARLPANLLQAQRDFFGAHTFERVDQPRGKFFHHDWSS